jgi:hypothetical protein
VLHLAERRLDGLLAQPVAALPSGVAEIRDHANIAPGATAGVIILAGGALTPVRSGTRGAPMTLFTVEVRGRPTLVFSSRDREAVGEVLAAAVSGDLAVLGRDGRPIWDGASQLALRQARPEEATRWQQGFARAVRVGESALVFLVEVVGPADAEEDE